MRTTNVPDPMTRRQPQDGDAPAPAQGESAKDALIRTVRRMRQAQKDFYANAEGCDRNAIFRLCRHLERAVDVMLQNFQDAQQPAAASLFEEADRAADEVGA